MYSLMIVEDEEELLESLSRCFPWEKLGFEVVAGCQNGKAALKYLEEHQVDVLLTDIRLPFLNGLDLIQQVKEKGDPPLFCILTAYSDFESAKKAIQLGVEDYLVKPAGLSDIEEAFKKIKGKLRAKPDADETVLTDNPVVRNAAQIMNREFATCTLQSVASALGISDAYLSRLFKEKTGKNFQEYLLEKKMEHAVKMLSSPAEYRNSDIAAALGYQDAQNFCRIFKRCYGMSPQQYKKEVLRK